MDSEDQTTEQPQPLEEDAIDLTIRYSPERQALLWEVEYNGELSSWSERSLQEAIGALALVHMETEDLNKYSMTEYGINFNGYNYKTQDTLGAAVLCYLSDRGYRFSGLALGEPSLILCGFGDGDQAPESEPNKQLKTATASSTTVATTAADSSVGTLSLSVGAGTLLEAPQQVWRGEAEGELITALFAGKQMWVAASSRGRDEAETFQLNYLDFKSQPLPSLQAAKLAAPAFARAVLAHMQSLISGTEADGQSEVAPTQPEPQRTSVAQPAQPAVPVDRPSTSVFGFEAGADPYTQVMFGVHAQHVPAWLYVQAQSNGAVLFVGASRSTHLTWDGTKTHQFMLGELIARPHFVVESDAFRGHGISGLARANHLDFVEAADRVVLCDPMRLIEDKAYNTNMVWY